MFCFDLNVLNLPTRHVRLIVKTLSIRDDKSVMPTSLHVNVHCSFASYTSITRDYEDYCEDAEMGISQMKQKHKYKNRFNMK